MPYWYIGIISGNRQIYKTNYYRGWERSGVQGKNEKIQRRCKNILRLQKVHIIRRWG